METKEYEENLPANIITSAIITATYLIFGNKTYVADGINSTSVLLKIENFVFMMLGALFITFALAYAMLVLQWYVKEHIKDKLLIRIWYAVFLIAFVIIIGSNLSL